MEIHLQAKHPLTVTAAAAALQPQTRIPTLYARDIVIRLLMIMQSIMSDDTALPIVPGMGHFFQGHWRSFDCQLTTYLDDATSLQLWNAQFRICARTHPFLFGDGKGLVEDAFFSCQRQSPTAKKWKLSFPL